MFSLICAVVLVASAFTDYSSSHKYRGYHRGLEGRLGGSLGDPYSGHLGSYPYGREGGLGRRGGLGIGYGGGYGGYRSAGYRRVSVQ